MSVLEIEDLTIEYETEGGHLRAVNDVNMAIKEEEFYGIVGESGSGKSTIANALLGILPKNARIRSGGIYFDGKNLFELSQPEMNTVRWNDISMVMQSAMNALDPVYRIEDQFVEVIRKHTEVSRDHAKQQARELLEKVDINPERVRDYPHELSGGQRQRVVIALAIALNPTIVLADEPTTGLDVLVQDKILNLLRELQREIGNSVIIITHDMSVVAELCDRVGVMYAGQLVEEGTVEDVFENTSHPYTIGLKNAFPTLEETPERLVSIPGSAPDLVTPPKGCLFRNRCAFATEECELEPKLQAVRNGHRAKCHYVDKRDEMRREGRKYQTWVK